MVQILPQEIDESALSQQLKDVFEKAEASVGEDRSDITVDISTQALWRAILATETSGGGEFGRPARKISITQSGKRGKGKRSEGCSALD